MYACTYIQHFKVYFQYWNSEFLQKGTYMYGFICRRKLTNKNCKRIISLCNVNINIIVLFSFALKMKMYDLPIAFSVFKLSENITAFNSFSRTNDSETDQKGLHEVGFSFSFPIKYKAKVQQFMEEMKLWTVIYLELIRQFTSGWSNYSTPELNTKQLSFKQN